ncbi:MAG: response regulator transcription factor [Cyanobacteria bacterium]|nr:response regulator transcription factor [Cyanobacteriota bacterium]
MLVQHIKIILAEDHLITRFGLSAALQDLPNVTIVAEVGSGQEAIDATLNLHPHLILMDIGLPVIDGIQATQIIKESLPSIRVMMMTSRNDDKDVFAALAAGADGYCLKDISVSLLGHAINSVIEGALWIDPEIGRRVLRNVLADRTAGKQGKHTALKVVNNHTLSDRELEVLKLVVEGLANQQIAERLFLSIETVKTHMRRVMEKLQVSDRTQAAVKAIREGLLNGSGR